MVMNNNLIKGLITLISKTRYGGSSKSTTDTDFELLKYGFYITGKVNRRNLFGVMKSFAILPYYVAGLLHN